MRTNTIVIIGTVLAWSQIGAKADLVTLNTSALEGLGSFTLDFQLVSGGAPAGNSILLDNFSFGGGSAFPGSASTVGSTNVTVSPLSVSLSDASFFNEAQIPFLAGATVAFQYATSGPGGTPPDAFTLGILQGGVEIPTTSPLDSFLEVDFNSSTNLTVLVNGSDASQTSINIPAPDVSSGSATPEPAYDWLLGAGLALLLARRVCIRRGSRAMAAAILAITGAQAQEYAISPVAISGVTPVPNLGGTFQPIFYLPPTIDENLIAIAQFSNLPSDGIWLYNASTGTFSRVAAIGDIAPSGGTFDGFHQTYAIVKGNQVIFLAHTTAAGGSTPATDPPTGYYSVPVAGGAASLVADQTTLLPGVNAMTSSIYGFTVNYNINTSLPQADDLHVGFYAAPSASAFGDFITSVNGSGLAELGGSNTPLSWASTGCFIFPVLVKSFTPRVTGGKAAFLGNGSIGGLDSLFVTTLTGLPSSPTCIAPGGGVDIVYPPIVDSNTVFPGVPSDVKFITGGPFAIDDTRVYFTAFGNNSQALFAVNLDGSGLTKIVGGSDVLPGLPTPPYSFQQVAAQNGVLAFTALNSAPNPSGALFIYNNGGITRVFGTGDTLAGATNPIGQQNVYIGPNSLSNGQVAFFYANQTAPGIFLATPAACATNVTSQVSVVPGGLRYNHATNEFLQVVTLRNTSGSAIPGPVSLILNGNLNTAGSTVALQSPAGLTTCLSPLGDPYVVVNGGTSLAPGAQVSVILGFSDPSFAPITYSTSVVSGSNR